MIGAFHKMLMESIECKCIPVKQQVSVLFYDFVMDLHSDRNYVTLSIAFTVAHTVPAVLLSKTFGPFREDQLFCT